MQRGAEQGAAVDERLLAPPLPACVSELWRIFLQLSGTRGAGFGVPAPISVADVAAWCALNDARLNPWELETLFELDAAALRAATAKKTAGNHE